MSNNLLILSDEDLWKKFLAGDQEAFKVIYEKSVSELFIYGSRISSDSELVKDCIQDLFIEIHRTRSKLNVTNRIMPYLMVSLKRLIIKKLKEQNLDKRVGFDQLSFEFLLDNDDKIIRNEQEEDILQKALDQLSPRQREAIYLKYVAGLDYEELSKVLNLNYQTSRNLIYRGLQKLRESLDGKSVLLFCIFTKLASQNKTQFKNYSFTYPELH